MGHAAVAAASSARSRAREYWPLLAIALAASAIAIVVHTQIFPAYSWNRDEVVYLWQTHALRDGHIFTSGGGTPLFFQPWLSGIRDGSYFSQYTLGWPLMLLAGDVVFGTAAAALVVGTLLAVAGTYALARELTSDHHVALVAAAALVISPVLVIQSGIYLNYLFSVGLGMLFGASFLAGLRRSRRGLLVASGGLVGYLFMTRPFDALLWAAAFGAYVAFANWRHRRAMVRAVAWALVGFVPLLVATLAYNRYVTGSFTQFPITAADSRDTFGFGIRGIGNRWATTDFGFVMGVKGVVRNGVELPPFLLGSYLGVVAAAAGFWIRRRERSTYALLALGAVFPLGYLFFWGISLSAHFANVSGPIYFIPLIPLGCIFLAIALTAAWRARRVLAIVGGVVLVAATIPFMVDRLDNNHALSESQVPWREAKQEFRGRSLVFVEDSGPYLLHLNPYSENPPDLDGRVLYAADRYSRNLDLIASHPGRRVYFERTNFTIDETLNNYDLPVPTITVTEMQVQQAPSFTLRVHVTNPTNDPVVVVYLKIGPRVEQRTLSTTASKGDSFETEWQIAPPGAAAGIGAAALDSPSRTVTVGMGAGTSADTALALRQVRDRYSYRITGTTVELLTPGRLFNARMTRTGGFRLRRATTSPSLSVDVVPAPNR